MPEVLDTATKTMKTRGQQKRSETVLVVEDESMVSDLARKILERYGYTVLAAANGREALDLYEEKRNNISLVILDLNLPEIGGFQCLEKLRELDPKVKILVTTGHSIDEIEKRAIEAGARGVLLKPFSMKQILTAVRDVLGSD